MEVKVYKVEAYISSLEIAQMMCCDQSLEDLLADSGRIDIKIIRQECRSIDIDDFDELGFDPARVYNDIETLTVKVEDL